MKKKDFSISYSNGVAKVHASNMNDAMRLIADMSDTLDIREVQLSTGPVKRNGKNKTKAKRKPSTKPRTLGKGSGQAKARLERRRQAFALRAKGMNADAISEKLNVSKTTVLGYFKKEV